MEIDIERIIKEQIKYAPTMQSLKEENETLRWQNTTLSKLCEVQRLEIKKLNDEINRHIKNMRKIKERFKKIQQNWGR